MEKGYKCLLEKYLKGTASKTEAAIVLKWLETETGKEYYKQYLKSDFRSRDDYALISEDEQQTWLALKEKIQHKQAVQQQTSVQMKRRGMDKRIWLAAACILVITGLTVYLTGAYQTDSLSTAHEEAVHVIYHTTDAKEHKVFTLADGTKIRLNENSKIGVPSSFSVEERHVILEGEAFFEVSKQLQQPFKVRSGEGLVTVMGTKFSVKQNVKSQELYVVVSEGLVSLGSYSGTEDRILEKNMIGIFNEKTSDIHVEQVNAENYLNWIHGRIAFDGVHFSEVIRQLSRIYGIDHQIRDIELNNLRLTADLYGRDLEKVLETIAHSLDIHVALADSVAYWSSEIKQHEVVDSD